MPKVSVVIPVYNGERFLADALQSVVNQTFRDLEIIVVDDGSTDGTGKIVRQFPGPISYHRQENQGAGVARNVGVSLAQGEWVAFLDADDVWYPEKLSVQVECAEAYPGDSLFYSDMDIIDEEGHVTQKGFLSAKVERQSKKNRASLVSRIFNGLPFPYPSTVLVRRDAFLKAGGFNPLFRGNYHEDFDLFARISRLCSIHFIPQGLVKYRVQKAPSRIETSTRDENWPILLNCLWDMWREEPEKQAVLLKYYAKYFSEKGRRYLRSGHYRNARAYFRLAYLYQPFYGKNLRRWMISLLPGIRRFYLSIRAKSLEGRPNRRKEKTTHF